MKRSFDPAVLEMMDRPQPVSRELERDLERLRQLNRWFGSHHLVSMFMRRWIMPGAQIEIDALDQQAATVEIARGLSAGYPEISYHAANILEWDCAHGYDIALC